MIQIIYKYYNPFFVKYPPVLGAPLNSIKSLSCKILIYRIVVLKLLLICLLISEAFKPGTVASRLRIACSFSFIVPFTVPFTVPLTLTLVGRVRDLTFEHCRKHSRPCEILVQADWLPSWLPAYEECRMQLFLPNACG